MASEDGSSKSSQHSVENIQQDSKLIRSASENSNLAHCWARQTSVTNSKTFAATEALQKTSQVSGSMSLQEISSLIFSAVISKTIKGNPGCSDLSHRTDCNLPDTNSIQTCMSGKACSKQYDVHVPSVVFEEKETCINAKDDIPQMTQTAHESNQGASSNVVDSPPDVTVETNKNKSKEEEPDCFFFWGVEEAKYKQVEQIGASACGATAIINMMNVLGLHPDLNTVASAVKTNLRAEDAPLPEYLFSRSDAGATHEALIQGIEKATHGSVYARFFAFYPKRKVDVKQWMMSWMKQGAVPLATLNLQAVPVGEDGDIHDAWHHQMIYGVDQHGIYMCNPIIMETQEHLQPQLCSESVLLVRRFDILKRWHKDTNLSALALHEDTRWREMDVLGQAVNMLLEDPPSRDDSDEDEAVYEKELTDWFMRCHVRIPAAYTSGITLCVRKDNQKGYHKLLEACDLPLDDDGEI